MFRSRICTTLLRVFYSKRRKRKSTTNWLEIYLEKLGEKRAWIIPATNLNPLLYMAEWLYRQSQPCTSVLVLQTLVLVSDRCYQQFQPSSDISLHRNGIKWNNEIKLTIMSNIGNDLLLRLRVLFARFEKLMLRRHSGNPPREIHTETYKILSLIAPAFLLFDSLERNQLFHQLWIWRN